jgi:hypothetical protein
MCKEIVQVPSKDKYIFQFSKKGKQFDIQHLKENLLKLIEKSLVPGKFFRMLASDS